MRTVWALWTAEARGGVGFGEGFGVDFGSRDLWGGGRMVAVARQAVLSRASAAVAKWKAARSWRLSGVVGEAIFAKV